MSREDRIFDLGYKKGYDQALKLKDRPKGKWIRGYTYPDGEYWKCNKCKDLIQARYPMKYCSNCGAKMFEVENE